MSGKARKRTRGFGRIFRQRYRDRKNGGWKFTETFYIEYWLAGKMYREATHSTRQSEALDLLNQRRGEHALGQFVEPRAQRTTLGDLLQVVDTDYTVNGKRSLRRMREHAKHLTRFFGTTCRAGDLVEPRIDGYAQHRLGEGAARATVNRELGCLRRALRLGRKKKLIQVIPDIALLDESDNVRQGFFERPEVEAVCACLTPALADVVWFAYLTGWRRGEILTLCWSDVDRDGHVIRLRPAHSKNKRAREIPIEGELALLMQRRRAARGVELDSGEVYLADHVFHRRGAAIKDFRGAWLRACREAGVPGRLFHDLRRTAVRDMIRAGVDPAVAMKISGHKTRNVFDRYNIVNVNDQREAVRRTDAYRAGQAEGRTVVPLRDAASTGRASNPVSSR